MAKIRKGKLGDVQQMLTNIKKLNGKKFIVTVGMASNGQENSENPAYYGGVLEEERNPHIVATGRDYKFLSPALDGFEKELDVKPMLNKLLRADGKKRGDKEMIKASKEYGKKAVERVQYYILYDAPQYPDRERKNPTLVDTCRLFDSFQYRVYDSKGKIVGRGK